jgi:hypothetical protein
LQSQPVGVAVAMGGMFAGSLIIFRFYLLALVERSQETLLQEICQPDLRDEEKGKALSCNRMQRRNAISLRLR